MARHKIKVKKDREKHGTYQEMIQTWVTYSVVKVIFLYGLNPELNTSIKKVAPQIQTYIQYIKDPKENTYETAEIVHKSLFNKTLHSSYF